ncbi:MAG TPA: FTR1 family protein [Bacteroidota bacterium]|nr:FTR1 family protein [Bacteroidota bacterium]
MSFWSRKKVSAVFLWLGVFLVAGVMVWQGVAASGAPDPGNKNLNPAAVILSCGVLVFREGLEAILVLAAVTAAMTRRGQSVYSRGILAGAGAALVATVATWFIVVAILSSVNLPELHVQAATGLLAIAVLLVVMNWFFHRVYWTGWITHHTNRRRELLIDPNKDPIKLFRGFALLGFTAIYREGFEIVLFLQQMRLEAGNTIVLAGASIGIFLTAVVAVLTFVAHHRLPYKHMLVLTGVMLAGVLLVMVGESVQEMQQAGWIPATPIDIVLPEWTSVWFALFPNVQGLVAQFIAVIAVLGSYFFARYFQARSSQVS